MRVDKSCKSLGLYLIVDGFWRCSVIGHNECWFMQPWNVKSDTCSWNKVSVFSLLINFFQLCIKLEPCFVKSKFLVKGRIISIMNQALYIKYIRNQVLLLTVRCLLGTGHLLMHWGRGKIYLERVRSKNYDPKCAWKKVWPTPKIRNFLYKGMGPYIYDIHPGERGRESKLKNVTNLDGKIWGKTWTSKLQSKPLLLFNHTFKRHFTPYNEYRSSKNCFSSSSLGFRMFGMKNT